jgi:hypothetical protein
MRTGRALRAARRIAEQQPWSPTRRLTSWPVRGPTPATAGPLTGHRHDDHHLGSPAGSVGRRFARIVDDSSSSWPARSTRARPVHQAPALPSIHRYSATPKPALPSIHRYSATPKSALPSIHRYSPTPKHRRSSVRRYSETPRSSAPEYTSLLRSPEIRAREYTPILPAPAPDDIRCPRIRPNVPRASPRRSAIPELGRLAVRHDEAEG